MCYNSYIYSITLDTLGNLLSLEHCWIIFSNDTLLAEFKFMIYFGLF